MLPILANGQHLADTIRLQESEIVGRRVAVEGASLSNGSRAAGLDWALQPLSEISYKTYGLSGVGSLSYRGLPASQTPLLWHGINLASPLLGQADINQTPISPEWAAFAREAGVGSLTAGNALPSAVAIGHRRLVSDTTRREVQVRTRLTAGLYAARQSETSVEAKSGALSVQARLWYQQAANDFHIQRGSNSDSLLPIRQTNAETRNLQQELGLQYKAKGYGISAGLLSNASERNLPPPLTKYRSLERLTSRLTALHLSQIFEGKRLAYVSTLGFVRDHSRYRFENGVDESPYATQSFQATGRLSWAVRPGLSLSLDHSHQSARPLTGAYPARNLQAHAGILTASWARAHWQVAPALQVHGFGGRTYVYPAFRLRYSPSTDIATHWRVEVQTRGLFRSPTLNDLYYPQSGDPNLKPEQGRLYEAGLHGETRGWMLSLTPFLYRYTSFIAWVPQGNLWAPRQREGAASSGFTALTGYEKALGTWQLGIRMQGTWSRGGYGGSLITVQQRPEVFLYAPAARLTGTLTATHRRLRLGYDASYTGERVIDSRGEAPALQPFVLHTLSAAWSEVRIKPGSLSLAVQATLADPATYAFIANYAAPRFWGSVSATYQIGYAR